MVISRERMILVGDDANEVLGACQAIDNDWSIDALVRAIVLKYGNFDVEDLSVNVAVERRRARSRTDMELFLSDTYRTEALTIVECLNCFDENADGGSEWKTEFSFGGKPFPVSQYLSQFGRTKIYLSERQRRLVAFVDRRATNIWVQALESVMCRLMPWYYPADLSEEEQKFYRSIAVDNKAVSAEEKVEIFVRYVNEVAEKINFRDFKLHRLLDGIADRARQSRISALSDTVKEKIMPNWVQNEIVFENASDEKVAALIRELKLATESEDRAFDFNKIIPMPESLNIESGSSTDWSIAYYVTERLTIPVDQTNLRDLIHNSFNDDWAAEVVSRIKTAIDEGRSEDWDKVYEAGKQYMYNREHYGCYTWYEWCCRHWGTKWNACEPDWSLDDGMLVFQTAWSAPFPVIEALAQKYPDLEFTHRWADEDIGSNCGEMWWSEGCGSDIDIGDERTFAMSVWGYTEDDFDDEDDYDDDETSYSDVVQDGSDPEVFEVGDPETVDSGLSISDLI